MRADGNRNVGSRFALAAAGALLLVCSCARSKPEGKAADPGIRKVFERGPVAVTLSLDRRELTIAERLRLQIEVTAEESYEAQLPAFGDKLEQFGIVDYHTSAPELVQSNRTRVVRSYTLEPFLSGEYTIPTMTIAFRKKGEAAGEPYQIETEPLTVAVKSLLPQQAGDLRIHEIAAPVELPRSPASWLWPVGAGAAAVLAAAAWFLWRRRRHRAIAAARRVPAHEIAFRELERLVGEKLIEKGQIKGFYQRVSDILRRYIENRFGLRAPEETTQEFLEALRTSEQLNRQYRSLLGTFLTHCDLVKFAEHQPVSADIQRTFDSCKAFIVGTQEPDGAAAAGPIRMAELGKRNAERRHLTPDT